MRVLFAFTSVPVLILRLCERLPILGPSMMPPPDTGKVLATSGASSIGLSRPMKNSQKYPIGLFHGLDQQQHAFTVFGTKFNIMSDQRKIELMHLRQRMPRASAEGAPLRMAVALVPVMLQPLEATRVQPRNTILPARKYGQALPFAQGRYFIAVLSSETPDQQWTHCVTTWRRSVLLYRHSPVARTFFCCTIVCAHSHLHACAHTRMAQVPEKGSLHMCHISPYRLLPSHDSPVVLAVLARSLRDHS